MRLTLFCGGCLLVALAALAPPTHSRTAPGSEQVLIGAGKRLFLRETLALCAPEKKALPAAEEARKAILAYAAAAKARGVALVVVPIPEAPVLYPEDVWPSEELAQGPVWSDAYRDWRDSLLAADVDVLDVASPIWSAKNGSHDFWLPQNSHWSPPAAAVAGRFIAGHIRPLLGAYPPMHYETRLARQAVPSDLSANLPAEERAEAYGCDSWLVENGGRLVTGDDAASVLLFGDSFSRIYSVPEKAIVPGADLGRQIALALGAPVQVIAENGKNASETRALLLQNPGAVRQKHVVIWEFATRWLLHPESWKPVEFPANGSPIAVH
jgi:hypothetical protein